MTFPHMNMAKAEPAPPPPDVVAGIGEEVRFLRSRNFVIFKSDVDGFWKVDGKLLNADAIRDKAATVRARMGRNAPAPVAVTGEAPVAIVSTVKADDWRRQSTPGRFDANPGRFRGEDPARIAETVAAVASAFGVRRFAEAAGCAAVSVSQVKNGKQPPTAKMIETLFGPEGTTLLPKWVAVLEGEPASCGPRIPGAAEPTRVPDPDFVEHERAEAARTAAVSGAPRIPGEAVLAVAADPAIPAEMKMGPSRAAGAAAVIPSADDEAAAAIEAAGAAMRGERAALMAAPPTSPPPAPNDAELVMVLRDKLAGINAELEALEAEEAALAEARQRLNLRGLDLNVKRDRLQAAIEAFEEEPANG